MSNNNFEYLFNRFLTKSISEEEKKELAIQILNKGNDKTIEELVQNEWDNNTADHLMSEEKASAIIDSILNNDPEENKENKKSGKIVSLFYLKRIAVAAILVLGVFTIYKYSIQKQQVDNKLVENKVPANDVAPGGNRAILQLADGSTIILDSTNNGNIANQGQTTIIKIDGQLAYNSAGSTTEILYNTISTPRGGQYQLILADGTKVWLNAASSLRFPTNFTGKERSVTLTGEGYFEVAKNENMPFKVDVAGRGDVEVLGTHFNVNAYDDEVSMKTTLLEGKVKAHFSNQSLILLPNQQAIFKSENNSLRINKEVDVNKVIAWKNGLFDFDDDDITDIMRQLARWYDVEIQFNGKISAQHFTGAIPRKVAISKVLQMLEQAGGVHFKINNKTIEIKTD